MLTKEEVHQSHGYIIHYSDVITAGVADDPLFHIIQSVRYSPSLQISSVTKRLLWARNMDEGTLNDIGKFENIWRFPISEIHKIDKLYTFFRTAIIHKINSALESNADNDGVHHIQVYNSSVPMYAIFDGEVLYTFYMNGKRMHTYKNISYVQNAVYIKRPITSEQYEEIMLMIRHFSETMYDAVTALMTDDNKSYFL